MTKGEPDPIDVHVGRRVRSRRKELNMSQSQLGERLGVTFQQIQKYERGTNRMGSSRLAKIADALEVPVTYLFLGTESYLPSYKAAHELHDLSALPEDFKQLLQTYCQLPSDLVRRKALALFQALATFDPSPRC